MPELTRIDDSYEPYAYAGPGQRDSSNPPRRADAAWSRLHLPMSVAQGIRLADTDANVSRPAKHCIMPSEKEPSQSAVNRISDRRWHTLGCRGEGSGGAHRAGRRTSTSQKIGLLRVTGCKRVAVVYASLQGVS